MPLDNFFEELKLSVEFLNANPEKDSEALRHDTLIFPFLTNNAGLNWKPVELIPQENIKVKNLINKSHLFRNAEPKKRIPDILIQPLGSDIVVAAIEEKRKQKNIISLNEHKLQVHEYQAICECTWGILTDGQKWIIKRNFENWGEFSSINELYTNIKDIQNAIGREAVLNRIIKQNSPDLIFQSGLLQPNKANEDNIDFNVILLSNIWEKNMDKESREYLFKSWLKNFSPIQLKEIQTELIKRGSTLKEIEFYRLWLRLAESSFLKVNKI